MRGHQVERPPAPPRSCFSLQAPLGLRAKYHWPAAPGHPGLPWGQLRELTGDSKTPRTSGGGSKVWRCQEKGRGAPRPTNYQQRVDRALRRVTPPRCLSAKRGSDSPGSGERPRSHPPPPPSHQERGTASVQMGLVAGHLVVPAVGPTGEAPRRHPAAPKAACASTAGPHFCVPTPHGARNGALQPPAQTLSAAGGPG